MTPTTIHHPVLDLAELECLAEQATERRATSLSQIEHLEAERNALRRALDDTEHRLDAAELVHEVDRRSLTQARRAIDHVRQEGRA